MRTKPLLSLLIILLVVAALGGMVYQRLQQTKGPDKHAKAAKAVPVELAAIERGPIALRRQFTGTLEAQAEFEVSPKIDGRLVHLDVDLGDEVQRNQLVARLDDAEYVQAVAQAEADLAVAQANLAEARSLAEIAERELRRIDKLSERGVSSVSQRDTAQADQLAKQAHVQVTQAQAIRARSALETARIRLDYTQVRAAWQGGSDQRVVAERFVDEGELVSANTALLRIVELNPITAVFFVTERDYASLHNGQAVELRTDAYPGESFHGRISRIAPVFREETRQARVEISADNPGQRLKPGMYVRAGVVLESVEEATLVPEQALASRNGQKGLFLLDEQYMRVRWRSVDLGIREGDRRQIMDEKLRGRVVTLGQQLLEDGSPVILPANEQGEGQRKGQAR